jgi:hypothetical protein
VLRCAVAPAWTPLAYTAAHFIMVASAEPPACAALTHRSISSWTAAGISVAVAGCRLFATSTYVISTKAAPPSVNSEV